MKDGVVIFYRKNNTLYPIALSDEQNQILQIQAQILGPLKVIYDLPQCQVVDLREMWRRSDVDG